MSTFTRERDDLTALESRLATLKWRMAGYDRYTGKFELYDILGNYRGEYDVESAADYLDRISWDLEEQGR